jgi:hypothetical protein
LQKNLEFKNKSKIIPMGNKCICGKKADRRISIETGEVFIECCSKCSDRIKAEMLEVKENQIYRQGKSRRQYKTSLMIAMWTLLSILAIGVLFLIKSIWNY